MCEVEADENKSDFVERCEEDVDQCNGSLDSLSEEMAHVRRKSLRTAEQTVVKPLEVSGEWAIEEEEDLVQNRAVDIEYRKLIRLIDDHVIMPFDHEEWLEVITEEPIYKETPV